jgi:hypothetical protein
MPSELPPAVRWLVGPGPAGHLWPRWLLLRALGLIFFSAFYSLLFQIRGLIGPSGILPAEAYLRAVAEHFGPLRFWYAPTLFWLSTSNKTLLLVCWVGLLASLALVLNWWPRGALAVCLAAFLSFVSAAQDFASYQSDGMLLAAGFLALFFAPPGWHPGLGARHPPSRASRFLLQWLWLRIYFESGLAKVLSGDPQWRNLTALDQYYQNGPLPNWIGWYVQHLPHWFHAAVALVTLILELGLVWLLFFPRRFRLVLFFIVTLFQVGIILTANLAFLNYYVLALGVLLLDDDFLGKLGLKANRCASGIPSVPTFNAVGDRDSTAGPRFARSLGAYATLAALGWVFYNTTVLLLQIVVPRLPLPLEPVEILEPFRITNHYGLFAVMTTARYEIEFQGSRDGTTWIAYPFRYKPQDVRQPPRFFAPYQPRFDWNLWFASLGTWREYLFVLRTEERLLHNEPCVLELFASNPFAANPPRRVRAVLWQYWFTDLATKRATGLWWRRELRGLYAPELELGPDGRPLVVAWPGAGLSPEAP